jgi:Haem-degrading
MTLLGGGGNGAVESPVLWGFDASEHFCHATQVEGHCVGAVGVSGVKSSEDVQIARAGVATLAG